MIYVREQLFKSTFIRKVQGYVKLESFTNILSVKKFRYKIFKC